MRKTVLLAESSDATRSVAETILRQNGFDVISVTDGVSAIDAAERIHPDLLVVGAELTCRNQAVYDLVKQAGRLPYLVFAAPGQAVAGVGATLTIPRPFSPRDFLDRVQAAVSGQSAAAEHPLQGQIDDEQLDSALGMATTGVIRVTESEVLNQTRGVPQARSDDRSGLAFSSTPHADDDLDHTGRVESIIISEDQTDIRRPDTTKIKRPQSQSADPGGLDIMGDQYGLSDPNSFRQQQNEQAATHDYHWFVNEMQRESTQSSTQPASPAKPKERAVTPASDELVFTDPSSTLEPFNSRDFFEKEKPKTDAPGVEKFISEFKREIERFHSEEPENLVLNEPAAPGPKEPKWEELVESVTPERISLFTRQLAADLAERIAEKIVAKLDADKLANLLKSEIMDQLRSKTRR